MSGVSPGRTGSRNTPTGWISGSSSFSTWCCSSSCTSCPGECRVEVFRLGVAPGLSGTGHSQSWPSRGWRWEGERQWASFAPVSNLASPFCCLGFPNDHEGTEVNFQKLLSFIRSCSITLVGCNRLNVILSKSDLGIVYVLKTRIKAGHVMPKPCHDMSKPFQFMQLCLLSSKVSLFLHLSKNGVS